MNPFTTFFLGIFCGASTAATSITFWCVVWPDSFIRFMLPKYKHRVDFRNAIIYRKGQPPEIVNGD